MALKIFAYILGLSRFSFSVRMEGSDTVDDLRRAILNAHRRQLDVDATQLILYKVDLPDGPDLKQRVPQVPREELIVGSDELSELFPENPPAKTVSIFVGTPGIG